MSDDNFNWEDNLEVNNVIQDKFLDSNLSDFDDDFSDDWGDFELDDSEPEWETYSISSNNNSDNDIYYLDEYGLIYELDNYLNNGNGIIELLQHAKNKEQFNYILGMSKEEGHDDNLLNYLISVNYSIEDYISINVGYQIFKYEKLVEYLLSKANNDQIKEILSKIAYVNEKIARIISQRDDRIELIESNSHLRNKIVTKSIIQYFRENPDKIDLEVVNVCELDTELIKNFISFGYKITDDSPYNILQDNDIMRKEFLKTVQIENTEIFSKLDEEIKSIPGSYYMLYRSKAKEIFTKKFADVFDNEAFEQMIKYIVLGDYQIDLSKINDDNIKLIKNIYDFLAIGESFDIQLFIKIVYKFNMNPSIFTDFDKFNFDKDKLKLYFEFKELFINDINELNHIEEILYDYENSKIEVATNIIDLKNVICNLLTNQTYFEIKKGLLELANKEKLSVLKNSIKDADNKKKLDSFIILSDFIEKIARIENITQLKEIAIVLNQQILKNGINYNWINFNRKIMDFYSLEINERMTDFNKYLTDTFYDATDFTFNDGTCVNGKRVNVAHIKSGEEFNSLIHVLNAYQNGGTIGSIESVATPKFIGQAYISLTGISDEYSRICVNHDSKYSIKVLYSNIPKGDMFCAANRDTGINAKSNSRNIYTRLATNMAPFRRLVRNTETHGSETYNEFDVFRDNLVPSGIAFMNDEPMEEEINAAAYLGVPLVKIDDLQESFRKDLFSVLWGGLSYDESFYHIKEHAYENQEIVVSPNDKYDVMINVITEKISGEQQRVTPIDVFCEEDEMGYREYFVIYNGEKYLATPIYAYVDSKRTNIEVDYYEQSLIKSKIYEFLDIKPRITFANCTYPNGDEVISVISNLNKSRLIDKCIDFLVDVPNSRIELSELSNYNIDSIDELMLLNKLNSLDNNVYIGLFNSLIKSSNYIDSNIMLNMIIHKKEQLNLILSKYSEMLKQSQLAISCEDIDRFKSNSVSESSYIDEECKKI